MGMMGIDGSDGEWWGVSGVMGSGGGEWWREWWGVMEMMGS